MTVRPKTKPFAHQEKEYLASRDKDAWGLFWEMGCGKTHPTIWTAAHLEEANEITGMVVLAPNGVHRNWVVDELPMHMNPALAERMSVHLWQTGKASTIRHKEAAADTLEHDDFAVVAMSYNGIRTPRGAEYLKAFFKQRRCLYAADESQFIKSPGSKRTIRVLASAKYAPIRRALTGTLIDDKPFDVYAQVKFLDPAAWHALGIQDFAAFKATFGIWENRKTAGGDSTFPHLVQYRNMDLLHDVVDRYGTRLLKDDVLDLPPKLYSKRYFDLTPEQKKAYKGVRDEFWTLLSSGQVLSAELAITRLLRLQQVTSNYLPSDDDATLRPISEKNPRVALLVEVVEAAGHQVIVWAKYRQDITDILAALHAVKITAVRYDGACSQDELGQNVDAFKRGDAQVFVGNPAVGGTGLTLTVAKTMVYYNNSFRLGQRLQSEDRFHRIGQDRPVHVIDLCANSTVDNHIIGTLRKKKEVADVVMGDGFRDWI